MSKLLKGRDIKNILYITRLDPLNLKTWSGTNYFILDCLRKFYKIYTVGPLSNRIRLFYIFKRFFFSLFGIKFDIDRPGVVLKDFAYQIKKKTENIIYDAIFVTEPALLSFIETKKPIFIWSDFVFSTYYKHYFSKKIIHKDTINDGNFYEKKSLRKSLKIILTSKWAVNDASKYYKIPLSKFTVVPFGANIKKIPTKKSIIQKIKGKSFKVCKLITIGVHWDRKGVEKSIALTKMMNRNGQPTKLYIVGAKPPSGYKIPNNVHILKFLNKNIFEDRKELFKLLYNAHFHVLFTKAEACGIVFAEASAFGLYSITHNVGGVSGMIRNNINGFRFDIKKDNLEKISRHVINIFQNRVKYLKKSISSRIEYDNKLNWLVIGNKIKNVVRKNSNT
jgi:glycosyltransferase involved in cell wall biosynthesis